jgi:hypothetical protein
MDVIESRCERCWQIGGGISQKRREKALFERRTQGPDQPALGKIKGVVLRPGETLIMRPGYPVLHALLTIEDSFMLGGMIWHI